WRAVGVSTAADVADVAPGPADALLFDARPPAGAACEGGHGVAFDRAALRAYRAARPFVLAGGLTPDNVGPAVREARAVPGFCGVDVSSGVERAGTGKRRKDPEKIARFVQAAVAAFAEEPAQCASGA
ncbi:MAG: N-(5'-phosphoribosyl)anthranilate isomerase, partial [Pseudomonadota bacterium]